jgi:hypothetical protein
VDEARIVALEKKVEEIHKEVHGLGDQITLVRIVIAKAQGYAIGIAGMAGLVSAIANYAMDFLKK